MVRGGGEGAGRARRCVSSPAAAIARRPCSLPARRRPSHCAAPGRPRPPGMDQGGCSRRLRRVPGRHRPAHPPRARVRLPHRVAAQGGGPSTARPPLPPPNPPPKLTREYRPLGSVSTTACSSASGPSSSSSSSASAAVGGGGSSGSGLSGRGASSGGGADGAAAAATFIARVSSAGLRDLRTHTKNSGAREYAPQIWNARALSGRGRGRRVCEKTSSALKRSTPVLHSFSLARAERGKRRAGRD